MNLVPGGLPNAVRLAFGTLTVYPVQPPLEVDSRIAARAMVLGPLVGAALAAPLWLGVELLHERWSALLLGVAWVGGLALLTRGLHLDGLADVTDGLASGRPAREALEVMRRGDVGPLGVASVVVVVLLQATAIAQLLASRDGAGVIVAAVVASRLVLPIACRTGVTAARSDGLGATVAGTVTWRLLLVSFALALLLSAGLAAGTEASLVSVALVWVGPGAGALFCSWCGRRLGGITGDVLGACVEVSLTVGLLAACLA